MMALEVCGITKKYGNYTVIDDVTLALEEGRTYGFVGANGSGKSVLMKMIAGLVRPDDGYITVHGKRVGQQVDFPEDMGILIDGPAFIPSYSARMNLRLLAAYRKKIGKAQIDRAIELVGLDPASRKSVGKYSMGMRQRLGIAQTIMEDPALLLLDEPFNGLDKEGVVKMRELVKRLSDAGKTILMSSHNAQDIDLLCDGVYEMDAGVLTQIR